MNAIRHAAECLGSQAALADAIGVKQPTISEWVRGDRPLPFERCSDIERATAGAVTCEALRPDLAWSRIRDKAWPWHPEGRPVLDVTKVAA